MVLCRGGDRLHERRQRRLGRHPPPPHRHQEAGDSEETQTERQDHLGINFRKNSGKKHVKLKIISKFFNKDF